MVSSAAGTRSIPEQARLDAALVDLFEHKIRFNALIGLKIDGVQPDDVRASFPMRPELIGHHSYGRLHGGVVSSVLDALGGLALMVGIAQRHPHDNTLQVMQRFTRMATIDLRIDYLRPGLGESFAASAAVVRLGSRIGRTQMQMFDAKGVLIATAAGAYVVA